jgi:uncharacterized protein (TIGR02246 family)
MLPREPDEWPSLFEQHLNAGDLEAMVALYDPDASFVLKSGETIRGRHAIRVVLAGLIKSKARLHGKVSQAVVAGDTALLYTDWAGGEEPSRAIEVLRRQPDGTWLLIVGDPNGRG